MTDDLQYSDQYIHWFPNEINLKRYISKFKKTQWFTRTAGQIEYI